MHEFFATFADSAPDRARACHEVDKAYTEILSAVNGFNAAVRRLFADLLQPHVETYQEALHTLCVMIRQDITGVEDDMLPDLEDGMPPEDERRLVYSYTLDTASPRLRTPQLEWRPKHPLMDPASYGG
jgi:hypothetical protein